MGADTAPTGNPASDLLDVEGAAAYLGVPETYVRRMVLEGRVT
jgi:hypothetical protein